jgi:hypothetical protein
MGGVLLAIDVESWIENRNMNDGYVVLMKKYYKLISLSASLLVFFVALGTVFPQLGIISSLRSIMTNHVWKVFALYVGGPILDAIIREVLAND